MCFTQSHSIRFKQCSSSHTKISVPFGLGYEPNLISIVVYITSNLKYNHFFLVLFYSKMDQAPSRSVNALNFKCALIKINKYTFSVLFSLGGLEKDKKTQKNICQVMFLPSLQKNKGGDKLMASNTQRERLVKILAPLTFSKSFTEPIPFRVCHLFYHQHVTQAKSC